MTDQQKSYKYLLLSVIWTLITIVMLFAPKDALEVEETLLMPGMDKVVHFVLFAIWAFLVAKAFRERKKPIAMVTLGVVFISLAIFTEVIQHYIGRTFEVKDIASDAIGASIGLLIFDRI